MPVLPLDPHDSSDTLSADAVPAGDYQARVIGSKIAPSRSGELMLSLTWQITAGDHAEHMVFDRVMLSGSDQVVACGKRKIKGMVAAMGHPRPDRVADSEELHGHPCLITVAVREGPGEIRNEVENYQPLPAPAERDPEAGPADPGGGRPQSSFGSRIPC